MADKVALIDSEYSKLKSGVKNVHDDCLDQIKTVVDQIEKLNTNGGGFYAEELTPKINALISEINAIKSSMESVFSAHEEIIKSFQTVVDDYDTLS